MKNITIYIILIFSTGQLQSQDILEETIAKEGYLVDFTSIDSVNYIGKFEVTNIEYLEFLYYIKQDSSINYYESQLPDSNITQEFFNTCHGKLWFAEPIWGTDYLRYPASRHMPVVGVSYEQVEQYCLWRSNQALKKIKNDKTRRIRKLLKRNNIEIVYRLPSTEEWNEVRGFPKIDSSFLQNLANDYSLVPSRFEFFYSKQELLDNLSLDSLKISTVFELGVVDKKIIKLNNNYFLLVNHQEHPCFQIPNFKMTGFPNSLGLFGILGNVSEMSSIKGVAFGGNYMRSYNESIKRELINYEKAEPWLGFRLICQIIITPK